MVARSKSAESQNERSLFTIGHSNLEFAEFVQLLKGCAVDLVIDVRSRPHSARFPQFSQPGFEKTLEAERVGYLFLGEELGGRPDDPDVYGQDGVVDYRARRKSYAFQAGVERLLAEMRRSRCAFVCAEEDPLECHRFLMICPELVKAGVRPVHIRKESKIETQEEAENRLLDASGLGSVAGNTLFPEARLEALEEAYDRQAHKCAFRVDPGQLPALW